MRDTGVRNIVVSSSAAVYGVPGVMPITESCPADPINPYGETKLFMERMLADFARAHGISWTALRYFNAAGGDPEGETGERHAPETHLIPRALMALDGKLNDFHVMGDDYPTPDGTCRRDYIHVSDLAEGHVKAVEFAAAHRGLEVFNLGTGTPYSVLEIVKAFERNSHVAVKYEFGPRRAGDLPEFWADAGKARTMLGWQARRSLDDMCRDTWNWQKKIPRATARNVLVESRREAGISRRFRLLF